VGLKALAAFQAAGRWYPLTQGIGLRPQPWARFSRPVGPVLLGALTHEWWNRHRSSFEVVVSELVHLECADGDPAVAAVYTGRTDGRRFE
jgi:hypothetical protein